MAVYSWCKSCSSRTCVNENQHRSDGKFGWIADFRLGGQFGQRYREWFQNKEDAKSKEIIDKADFKRGTFVPKKKEPTGLHAVIDRYYTDHVTEHNQFVTDRKGRLARIKEWLRDRPIDTFTIDDMQALQKRLKLTRGAATVNRIFHDIRALFKKAIEWGYIQRTPCEFLHDLSEKTPQRRFASVEERSRLWAVREIEINGQQAPVPQKVRDYMELIFHTAARPISIKRCRWENGDVDFKNDVIWFTSYKGRKLHRYHVPMDDTVREIVKRRAEETGQKGPVFDTSYVDVLARKVIEASKINEGRQGAKFTLYGLKHCVISDLLMEGETPDDVARLAGLKTPKMIYENYGTLTDQHLRTVQKKIKSPQVRPQLKVV